MAYTRTAGADRVADRVAIALNLEAAPATVMLPGVGFVRLSTLGAEARCDERTANATIGLGPYEGLVVQLD